MATHYSILTWKTAEEPGRLQSTGPQRVGHDWVHTHTVCGAVVKNPPASAGDTKDEGLIPGLGRFPGVGNCNPLQSIFVPAESHGQRSVASYSPWDCRVGHNWAHTHRTNEPKMGRGKSVILSYSRKSHGASALFLGTLLFGLLSLCVRSPSALRPPSYEEVTLPVEFTQKWRKWQ